MLVAPATNIYTMKETEGEEDRPHEEPQHDQERLVAHPGAPGHPVDAQGQRDDDGRRRDRRVPLRRRLVRQPGDARSDGEPSELWLKRDHKHDLAFRPLETALEQGVVDAIYTQSKPFQHLQEATGKF